MSAKKQWGDPMSHSDVVIARTAPTEESIRHEDGCPAGGKQ